MKRSFTVKVKDYPGYTLDVLIRSPEWVHTYAIDSIGIKIRRGQIVKAWFWGSIGPGLIGTIALSEIDIEYVAHECCHAAHELLGTRAGEEDIALATGLFTKAIWNKIKHLEP